MYLGNKVMLRASRSSTNDRSSLMRAGDREVLLQMMDDSLVVLPESHDTTAKVVLEHGNATARQRAL
jgi:hypothetical protein